MKNFDFACYFETANDGTILIKCRDLPQLLSWSADGQPEEVWSRYAVEECIAFMLEKGLKVPFASAPLEGEYVVQLAPELTAKIEKSNKALEAQNSK